MKKIEKDISAVRKGSYAVLTSENVKKGVMLSAIELGKDIAFRVVINKLNEGVLARGIEINDVSRIFDRYDLDELGKVSIYVVGGDKSEESLEYAKDLMSKFEEIDNNRKILDITFAANNYTCPDFCLLYKGDFDIKT